MCIRDRTKVIRYKQAIYQDWKDNEISQTDYRRMREDYEEQEREINEKLKKLQDERAEQEHGVDTENPFLVAFRKYENITTLSREVLIELVDSIIVHEGLSLIHISDRAGEKQGTGAIANETQPTKRSAGTSGQVGPRLSLIHI